MSKKKAKTRIDKATTRHDFSHLTKTAGVVIRSEKNTTDKDNIPAKVTNHSPLESLVGRDLRFTGISIGSFILGVVVLALIIYETHLFSAVLSQFGLNY